jgi:hypothetical protein
MTWSFVTRRLTRRELSHLNVCPCADVQGVLFEGTPTRHLFAVVCIGAVYPSGFSVYALSYGALKLHRDATCVVQWHARHLVLEEKGVPRMDGGFSWLYMNGGYAQVA